MMESLETGGNIEIGMNFSQFNSTLVLLMYIIFREIHVLYTDADIQEICKTNIRLFDPLE